MLRVRSEVSFPIWWATSFRVMEEIVRLAEGKVNSRPLFMCIPMKRDKEGMVFGRERRWVNRKIVGMLEEWECDGLQL